MHVHAQYGGECFINGGEGGGGSLLYNHYQLCAL